MKSSAPSQLRYADLSAPGYGRKRAGRGFSYLSRHGRRLRNARLIDYCRSLVIPPAWNDVWISADRHAHILSTGVDVRSRKQYLYNPIWQAQRNLRKFDDMVLFAQHLPGIRESVEQDLKDRQDSKRRMLATAVSLIDQGLLRVGNEAYTKENGSHGATTLRARHVDVDGATIALNFRGKSGKQREVEIDDITLARNIRECQELPGQRLFQYRDQGGELQSVDSSDVNSYLQQISGQAFTAKNFRTWGGTVAAFEWVNEDKERSGQALARAAIGHVSERLGNTRTVARQYYIHPQVLAAIADDQLPELSRRARKRLSRAETSVLRFLGR